MATLVDVRWPAISFGRPQCIASFARSADIFLRIPYASIAAVSKMEEYYLIDSESQLIILGSPQICNPGIGVKIGLAYFLNLRVQVEYPHLEIRKNYSLNSAKQRLIEDVHEHEDFWLEGLSLDTFLRQIASCDNIGELINLLANVG